MTKYFDYICSRMISLEQTKAWYEGEKTWGIEKSLFISKDGVVVQYVDGEEGERFHKMVKEKADDNFLGNICDDFFHGLEKRDTTMIYRALAIFDEIDNYAEEFSNSVRRRVLRVRTAMEGEVYKFFKREPPFDYIFYKGELYIK